MVWPDATTIYEICIRKRAYRSRVSTIGAPKPLYLQGFVFSISLSSRREANFLGKYRSRLHHTLIFNKKSVSLRREQYYPNKNASRLDEGKHILFDVALVQARRKLSGKISLSSRRCAYLFSRFCSRLGERLTFFDNIALV